jgi:hypothetical protein
MYCVQSDVFMSQPRSDFFELPFKTFPANQENIRNDFVLNCHSLGTVFFNELVFP